MSDNFVLKNYSKVKIMLAVLFFGKYENYGRNDELCQKLCQHHQYQSLLEAPPAKKKKKKIQHSPANGNGFLSVNPYIERKPFT